VILIAGGIGITPLYCMIRRLTALGRSFELHYAVRGPDRAAFLEDIRALGARIHTHFDSEHGGAPLAIAPIVGAAPTGAHFYCCGPTGMLAAFEAATQDLPANRVHIEYFKPKEQPPAVSSGAFTVVLARSGQTFEVPPDKSILEVLLENGINADHSCMDGVCGSCETRVIDGVPDHRDSLLTKAERESNKTMMICVSRCLGPRLVLDMG
jgi:ferredoxin-NADP reductase